jgi:hypothetical protein
MSINEEQLKQVVPHMNEVLQRWSVPYNMKNVNDTMKSFILACIYYNDRKEHYIAKRLKKSFDVNLDLTFDGKIKQVNIVNHLKPFELGTAYESIIDALQTFFSFKIEELDYEKINSITFP